MPRIDMLVLWEDSIYYAVIDGDEDQFCSYPCHISGEDMIESCDLFCLHPKCPYTLTNGYRMYIRSNPYCSYRYVSFQFTSHYTMQLFHASDFDYVQHTKCTYSLRIVPSSKVFLTEISCKECDFKEKNVRRPNGPYRVLLRYRNCGLTVDRPELVWCFVEGTLACAAGAIEEKSTAVLMWNNVSNKWNNVSDQNTIVAISSFAYVGLRRYSVQYHLKRFYFNVGEVSCFLFATSVLCEWKWRLIYSPNSPNAIGYSPSFYAYFGLLC